MTIKVSELPQNSKTGFFALHIHDGDACSGENFSGTGGRSRRPPSHAGDLPPLLLFHGNAYLAVRTNRFSVGDIIGRTVVIHSDPDDFRSQPAGNAGTKIGCGLICKR